MVFAAGNGVVFVMIEIGSGEEKHVGFGGENFSQRFADGNERFELNCAESDGNEGEAGIKYLQERKLDFERMLALVSDGVFEEQRTSLRDSCGKIGVDRSIAERSAPSAFTKDCGFCPIRKMSNAE